MNICDLGQCTGCSACLNICMHSAISLNKGTNGHFFPVIDVNKCVQCKQCVNICPNNNTPEYHSPKASFIATALDSKESVLSTSAGIASVFSRYVIEQRGVVYGCCGEDCLHVQHIRISKTEDVERLKGSKYVQSDIGYTYQEVKKDLNDGLFVLFIGTPCQVAGLYSFLKQRYDKLYTIDLVCHGVPSQQILNDALKAYLPETDLKNVSLTFRKKENGKSLYGLFVNSKAGNMIFRSVYPDNEYITGFLCGLYYRESCYQCHYARSERVSDVTIGDYWDREKRVDLVNAKGGLSMVIVNTQGGQHLLDECSSMMNVVSGDFSDFVKRNGQLDHPIKKYCLYDFFVRDYIENGFLWAAKKNLKIEQNNVRRSLLKMRIKDVILSIPFGERIINFIRNR